MKYGTIHAEMTWQEAAQIEALKTRNEAMPVIEMSYTLDGEKHKYYKCPICEEYLYPGDVFCKTCGQKIDMNNIAL